MDGDRIREGFLRFFEERGHKRVPSSSLIPPPESGLLLTNAGMNQFIPYFLGHAPAPFPEGGDGPEMLPGLDIDNVGHTDRHETFFEMLGNFSFGDYFKAEACAWGFELVTEVWGIDPGRLWVTVFETDDEAIGIWRDIGIPRRADRSARQGRQLLVDAPGLGGPCSEIFVDRGPAVRRRGRSRGRTRIATWRSGTTSSSRTRSTTSGRIVAGELPAKNIDTGSGLERVACRAAGRRERVRDRPDPTVARSRGVALRSNPRAGRT